MFSNKKHEAAHAALKKGEVDKAILLYTEALQLNPNDCDILGDRATAFLHKKDQLRSMADFDMAVKLDPTYAYRYASRAFAKQNFGDIDGAVADYEKAVDLDPNDAVAQNNLGMLLEQQGYKKEADERFARADKLSKMEDNLYSMMDDLEGSSKESNQSEGEESLRVQFEQRAKKAEESSGQMAPEHQDSQDQTVKNLSTSKELKKVFTSRKQFHEFVQFVKNGFKLK